MTWLTWRQVRGGVWGAVGALAALGVLLAVTGRSISRAYEASGAATCGTDCDSASSLFLDEVLRGGTGTLYDLVTLALFVVPALVGMNEASLSWYRRGGDTTPATVARELAGLALRSLLRDPTALDAIVRSSSEPG